jgi:hypothetical protein
MIVVNISGAGLHLYVTWYAYQASGVLAAVFTFAIPGFSELFWLFPIAKAAGSWWNMYSAAVLVFVLGYLVMIASTTLLDSAVQNSET